MQQELYWNRKVGVAGSSLRSMFSLAMYSWLGLQYPASFPFCSAGIVSSQIAVGYCQDVNDSVAPLRMPCLTSQHCSSQASQLMLFLPRHLAYQPPVLYKLVLRKEAAGQLQTNSPNPMSTSWELTQGNRNSLHGLERLWVFPTNNMKGDVLCVVLKGCLGIKTG